LHRQTRNLAAPRPLSARLRRWSTALLVGPTVAVLVAFVLIPFLYVVRVSLATQGPYGSIGGGWTADNYAQFVDYTYLKILIYSVSLAAQNTVLCLFFGYTVAFFLAFRAGRAAPMLIFLLVLPFWASFLVRMSAWMTLLSPQGIVDTALHKSLLFTGPLQLFPSQGAVLVGLVYSFLPIAVFPLYASLRSIDVSLIEAARDLGSGPFGVHTKVVIPLARPGIVAATLLTFAPSLGVFVIPVLLGGGKKLILGNLIVSLFLEFRNMPFGAAVSVVFFVIVMIGILAGLRIMRGAGQSGRALI